MSAQSAILAGRVAAEVLMQDACTIKRATGDPDLDPVTLAEVPGYATVWSGPCRIQRSGALSPREASGAGGYEFGIDSVLAQIPLTATGVQRGDVLVVTAIGPASDPEVLGLTATVQANLAKTHATKRTLVCEEVT